MSDMNYNITDIVKGICVFEYYRINTIYYSTVNQGIKYLFPVDIEDVGSGTLEKHMKGITMMRWIRKAIEEGSFVKYED